MSEGVLGLFEKAEQLADQRRLIPAIQALEDARSLTEIPERRAWASYNLGAVHWHLLGDGIAAKREFLTAIKFLDALGYGVQPEMKTLHANALENAMLCSLSYDEFEDLGERLRELCPEAPIVTGLIPNVRESRDSGRPWSDTLISIGCSNYDRNDPARDPGRYGEGRSTFHLLLTNRRQLRVSREDWRMAIYEFCALSLRMATDYMVARGGDNDPNPADEFIPILTEAIPIVDEYLEANSGDDGIRKVRDDMDFVARNIYNRWEQKRERMFAMPKKIDYQVCQKCGAVYAQREMDERMASLMFLADHPVMCTKCGGIVEWQDSPYLKRQMAGGCAPALLIILSYAVLVVWIVR